MESQDPFEEVLASQTPNESQDDDAFARVEQRGGKRAGSGRPKKQTLEESLSDKNTKVVEHFLGEGIVAHVDISWYSLTNPTNRSLSVSSDRLPPPVIAAIISSLLTFQQEQVKGNANSVIKQERQQTGFQQVVCREERKATEATLALGHYNRGNRSSQEPNSSVFATSSQGSIQVQPSVSHDPPAVFATSPIADSSPSPHKEDESELEVEPEPTASTGFIGSLVSYVTGSSKKRNRAEVSEDESTPQPRRSVRSRT